MALLFFPLLLDGTSKAHSIIARQCEQSDVVNQSLAILPMHIPAQIATQNLIDRLDFQSRTTSSSVSVACCELYSRRESARALISQLCLQASLGTRI